MKKNHYRCSRISLAYHFDLKWPFLDKIIGKHIKKLMNIMQGFLRLYTFFFKDSRFGCLIGGIIPKPNPNPFKDSVSDTIYFPLLWLQLHFPLLPGNFWWRVWPFFDLINCCTLVLPILSILWFIHYLHFVSLVSNILDLWLVMMILGFLLIFLDNGVSKVS